MTHYAGVGRHGQHARGARASSSVNSQTMLKLYSFIGATVGSYAGWALGAPVGTMTAFMLSFVGTGLGIYAGRRVARYYGA